jgi:O-antigen ligase
MERIYRWIAAGRMFADRPLTGSGPQTFYPEYRKYTVSRFTTYVSNNPDKSTVHNYFLLQFAEQGVVGGILFLLLMGYALLLPEKIYHRTQNPEFKQMALAAGLCLFIVAVHLVLNELVETDKIGALFYISMAILVRLDNWTGKSQPAD